MNPKPIPNLSQLMPAQLKAPELKALAACEPPLARETQQLCAGRLITLVEAAGKAGLQPRPNPGKGPVPEGKGAAIADGAQPCTGPAERQEDGAAGGAHEHGAARENALLADVTAFLAKAAASKVRAGMVVVSCCCSVSGCAAQTMATIARCAHLMCAQLCCVHVHHRCFSQWAIQPRRIMSSPETLNHNPGRTSGGRARRGCCGR